LQFTTEVRAQTAPAAPQPPPAGAAPAAPPAGTPTTPAPSAPPATAPAETAPPATTPETSTAAPEASPAPAVEAETSSGGGLFESSQAGSGDAAPSDAGGARGFDLGGYARGDVFVGKETRGDRAETKAAYGELSLKVTTPKEAYGDAFAEARVRYGLQDVEQRVFLDLREAYVNLYLGPLDLRLGQQIIVWGRADAFNPTNNVSSLDLRVRSPVEDDRRIGNPALRAFLNFQPFRLEGVWQPLYVPSELPRSVVPPIVRFEDPKFPDSALENGLGAGRLHLETAAFEASASYLYGYAPLPGFRLSSFTGGETTAYVGASRTAYQHHVVGFDFSTAFGDAFALRGEAAYRRPIDWEDNYWSPRPDVQYVLGVDRTFGSVSVIAQYMGRYVFDWELERGPDTPYTIDRLIILEDPPRPPELAEEAEIALTETYAKTNQILFSQRARVQHMATLRVEWLTAHDTLSLSALGMMNFTTEEWLLFPKLLYKMSDALSATIGGEIYSGPKDTLFSLIEAELSAGYAELRYSF
jgi:hypothetical protein